MAFEKVGITGYKLPTKIVAYAQNTIKHRSKQPIYELYRDETVKKFVERMDEMVLCIVNYEMHEVDHHVIDEVKRLKKSCEIWYFTTRYNHVYYEKTVKVEV